MARSQRPALNRRLLRSSLRQLRTSRGETQKEVADALEWSPSKIMRIEAGQVGVTTTDLRALLGHYDVRDQPVVDQMLDLARESRRTSLKSRYGDAVSAEFADYLEYEEASKTIRSYATTFIPGPLQTEDYALAVMQELTRAVDPSIVERRIEARLARKEMLQQEDAPAAFFILDEAILWRQTGAEAGTKGLQIDQLEHLKELGANPNISIQFMPFAAGLYRAMRGSFVILDFDDQLGGSLLYQENAEGETLYRDEEQIVSAYLDLFVEAQQRSTPAARLDQIIDQVIAQYKAGRLGLDL